MGWKTNLCLGLIFLSVIELLTHVEGFAGRGGGGGGGRGGGGGGRGGGWGRGGSSRGSSKVSSGSGFKAVKGSTIKKAAVIGGTAYVGYKLGKLKSRFRLKKPFLVYGGGYGSVDFDDWNEWRSTDGFLCRKNSDCNWIDSNLSCQRYTLDFTPVGRWFDGDLSQIIGVCFCDSENLYWDDDALECRAFSSGLGVGPFIAIVIVISILFMFCVCFAHSLKNRFC